MPAKPGNPSRSNRPSIQYNLEKDPLQAGTHDASAEFAEGRRLAKAGSRERSRGWMVVALIAIGLAFAIFLVLALSGVFSSYADRINQ